MTESQTGATSWRLHDYVVGILGGGGVGTVAGVYFAARVIDNNLVIAVGTVIGALVGILMVLGSRRANTRFLTPTVVVMWILAVLSGAFLGLLYNAIVNFN